MKTRSLVWLCIALLGLTSVGAEPLGTAFTYQGELRDAGDPANGHYDLRFTLHEAASGGAQIGPVLTLNAVPVSEGRFSVVLDFGPDGFTGSARWLEIGVKTSGAAVFTTLFPRQPVYPTPYALYAPNAGNAILFDGQGPGAYVAKAGDTMAGALAVPADGFRAGVSQLVLAGGNVGIGTATPGARLEIWANSPAWPDAAIILANQAFGDRRFSVYHSPNNSLRLGDETAGVSRLEIGANGNVGIGTATPATRLDVAGDAKFGGTSDDNHLWLCAPYGLSHGGRIQAQNASGSLLRGLELRADPFVFSDGQVGIGTINPRFALDVTGTVGAQGVAFSDPHGSQKALLWADTEGADRLYLSLTASATAGPNFTFDAGGILTTQGAVSCSVLEIRGGADLAEPFPVSTKAINGGSVVVIDEENPGTLKLSEQAYDTHVAGVISGANGVNPGITLNDESLGEGGQNVALSGRVYVLADAANGAIKPGDLLTTSDVPGRAMKVTDHARAQGAILGKAMTGLKEGQGMVLVLVSLQ